MPKLAAVFDEKKFFWNGALYESRQKASEVQASYEKTGFETRLASEDGKHLVYSRRVSAQQTATGGN
jgi:hypothetical protein